MKYVKRLIVISMILLFGLFIYNDYDLSVTTNNITSVFNNLLAKANNSNLFDVTGLGNLISEDQIKNLKDSGISGSDISINATYYPYYDMLNDNEKSIYKQIYANVSSMKNIFVPVNDIDANGLKRTVEAVFYDHPELFWLNTEYSYKYTKDGKCVQVIMSFNEASKNIDSAKDKFNSAANTIISSASKYNNNYEKEKYVHDYIIRNTSYNTGVSLNQSAYSALVNKNSVCAGYARAFQYIMIKLGIPTYYVVGTASEDHAWNIVALDDGYYNVDVTWDDQDKVSYAYFNKTDKEFSSTHKRRELSLSLPNCNASKYNYSSVKNSGNTIKKIIRKYIITSRDNDDNKQSNKDNDEIIYNNGNNEINDSNNVYDDNVEYDDSTTEYNSDMIDNEDLYNEYDENDVKNNN